MILYVLRYFPTLTETFVYREIDALVGRGVPVTIAALGARADGALQDQPPRAPVLRPPRGVRSLDLVRGLPELAAVRGLAAHQRPRDVLRAAWIAREARRRGVIRVHAHFAGEAAEVGRAVADALGVPFGVTVHAVDLFRPRPSLPELLRAARPVVTIADHHRRVIADRYGVDAIVARSGVDPDVFAPTSRPPTPGTRLVSVGRYVPKKGIDALLRAIDGLDVDLRLVSDAPASLASARVTVGPSPPSQVPDVFRAADVFVLPCTIAADGDRDGVPVAILEAMAAGLPIVTTAVAGIPELVDDTVGWLVPPDRPDLLRRAIVAATDPVERRRRGDAARARILARGLTVGRQVDALLAAWRLADRA